ncbi:MAG: type I restriction-modification system subunit M N-terminal domain-containing protein, partial [Chloroflexi bacterium]|nr:type I restriction-modification system subunit M N-terminal domain-containing protein [Chloroflexota bacterium]
APKFKDYILPLVFLKRLSDVFEDEVERLSAEFGCREMVLNLLEQERQSGGVHLVRFYIPENARWEAIRQRTGGLGQYLTDVVRAVASENPRFSGVINMVDFNATTAGQRMISDEHLAALIQVLSRHRLGLADVEEERAEADRRLNEVLAMLGLDGREGDGHGL